ncbi:MAG: LPS assembly protein LptD [Rhodobacteraceae bacterium]|nr:LPS assembly protein LptD [Paracoccaceae bacterium]
MMRARLITLILALVLSGPLMAQSNSLSTPPPGDEPSALLVADRVFLTSDRTLIAEGNVEAFQGDIRLRAARITFDRSSGKLTVEGPIRIDQGDNVTVLAEFAELDKGLQNGLLKSARLVFNQQLQLASLQMTRIDGRYSQLYKTTVTSCRICENGRPPLWQIRARKVIHDQLERQLYFEDAQFRVWDVPVFYLPALRLPDPTLKRAAGILVPSLRTTTQLGTGLRLPYFIPLGPHKDLTLAPFISPKTRTLNLRYRQAFRAGKIEFNGAYTRDDLEPGEGRGYTFGTGSFDAVHDFKLTFDLKAVSDNAYLVDYGLPDLDRLQSEVSLIRVKRDSLVRLDLNHFKSLRDSEDDALIPSLVGDLSFQRRFFPARLGGEVRLGLELHRHSRTSDLDIVGRDIDSITVDLDWRRSWISTRLFGGGLRTDWQMGISSDIFDIRQDSSFNPHVTRNTPRAGLSFRLPMTRTTASGATHFLEPIAQISWSNVGGAPVPNDQSGFVEFDQGNLLSLSRFPANDRREDGLAFVYGLNWARFAPGGWQASATIGQVLRQTGHTDFTVTSGLSGTSSDILLAGQLKLNKGVALTARGLLDNSFGLSKMELRGDWDYKQVDLSGSYLWLRADAAEGRANALSEISLDTTYDVNPYWQASANLRYDISDARATTVGIGFLYRNECVTVDISLNRRYTSSTSVEPSTDFGFTISLNGFAVKSGSKEYRRTCNSNS